MLSTSSTVALIALSSTLFRTVQAQTTTSAALATMTSAGCFSSSGDLVFENTYKYQTSGYCQPICVALGKPVLGLTKGSDCWCGDLLPAANTQTDVSDCNSPCDGYDKEDCGGADSWTVWLTGISDDVASVANLTSTSASSLSSSSSALDTPDIESSSSLVVSPVATTSAVAVAATQSPAITSANTPAASVVPATTVLTVGGSTIVKTIAVASTGTPASVATSSSSVKQESHSSKSNTAGIAAGVVVGIVVLAAVIAAAVIFFRRRKSNSDSTYHRRQNSADATVGGGRLGGTTPGVVANPRKSTLNDSRLDPRVMVEKRQSGGSMFADNEDYSRRILRVANPDEL